MKEFAPTNSMPLRDDVALILRQTAQIRAARLEIEAMDDLYPLDCHLCSGTGLSQSWSGSSCSSCGGAGVAK